MVCSDLHRDEEPVIEERQTDYSRSRPKRLAVDYSPSAYAPIRFMEGKRLSSDRSPPKKKSRPSKKQSNATSTAKRKKVKSQEVLDSETEDTVGIKEDNIPQSIDSRRKKRKNSFSGNCINKKKAKCSNAQTPIEIANGSPNSETNDSQQPVDVDRTISNVSCNVLNSESPVRLPTVLSQTPDSVTVSQSLSRTVNIGKTSIVTHVRLSVFENTDLLAPLPDLRLSNSFNTKNDSASASDVGSIPSTLMLSHSEHPC